MRHQGNRFGGIMFMVISLIMAALFFTISFIIYSKSKMTFAFIPMIVGTLICLIPFGFGLYMLIKSNAKRKIMKTGKKKSCKVYNVIRVRNGYELIVTYRGESGNKYKQVLMINLRDAQLLKEDMWIECYIQGEDCYVDASSIVVTEEPFDSF